MSVSDLPDDVLRIALRYAVGSARRNRSVMRHGVLVCRRWRALIADCSIGNVRIARRQQEDELGDAIDALIVRLDRWLAATSLPPTVTLLRHAAGAVVDVSPGGADVGLLRVTGWGAAGYSVRDVLTTTLYGKGGMMWEYLPPPPVPPPSSAVTLEAWRLNDGCAISSARGVRHRELMRRRPQLRHAPLISFAWMIGACVDAVVRTSVPQCERLACIDSIVS